jgi:hypothetical protein
LLLGLVLLRLGLDLRLRELHRAAGRLDHRARPLAGADLLESHLARQLAGEDHLGAERLVRNDARGFQGGQVDFRRLHPFELARAHFGDVVARERLEAALGQAALQRHLPALEADLVESTRAGALALVAAPGGLAPSRAHPAADAVAILLRARGGLQRIQSHGQPSTRTR